MCVAEESDGLTEYEEDGMDTVREEEGEEEEDEADDPEDNSPGEWGANDLFQSVSSRKYTKCESCIRLICITIKVRSS